ncbi:transcriptional regulator [Paramyrothecium foliicola]|nr:transcriptional regulator [Paramyrothecium foliicola]
MAPPSAKAIEGALIRSTCDVWKDDPDGTSVNKVRQHVEEKLELEEGFLSAGDWKQKSKSLIKEYVTKLLDGWDPDASTAAKRDSPEPQPPKAKRQKRSTKNEKSRQEAYSDESADEGRNTGKRSKATAHRAKKTTIDEGDDAPEGSTSPVPQKDGGEDDEMKHESDNGNDISAQAEGGSKEVAEEDEYSDVIDEPPPTKRKKGQKKETVAKTTKQPKTTKKSTPTPEDPHEAEVKKLQSQLTKCGVRKLWHNELKQYGDDVKAKIRHLKKMLADIGMEGRFSEAKAREIKETRELLADVEAAREMDALWGTNTGTRASRSKSKTVKEDDSGGSEHGDENEETDEENTFAARRRRAQADLAFLGDESDSD